MLLMEKNLAIAILAFKAASTIWKLENSTSRHLLNTLFLSKFGIQLKNPEDEVASKVECSLVALYCLVCEKLQESEKFIQFLMDIGVFGW